MPMSDIATNGPSRGQKLYIAAWRWHFYAGIVVIPFLIMLAVTGAVILWVTTISPEYGDLMPVTPGAQALSIAAQEETALAAYPGGSIGQYIAPRSAETPALFRVDLEEGARMLALDPYSGAILHDRAQDGTWNEFATDIHASLMIGVTGDRIIEIAASLGVILVISGLYLWWPRGDTRWSEVLVPRLAARGRAFWKSLHMVTGFWMSLVLVFFLISGLAWTGVWGGMFVQAWSSFPAEKWDNVPLSAVDHSSMNHGAEKQVPWTLEQTPMPESGSAVGINGLPPGTPAVLDSIVALGRAIGFQGRFQVNYPAGDTGVWTLSQDSMSYDSADPTADRTVHVDQYSGKILASVGFADYSLAGKAMAVGIALHEGQMGPWNIVLNLCFCGAILLISLSGIVMWWKRRPAGVLRLAAPPLPADQPMWKGAVLVGLAVSLAFPMAGLTLLSVMALDLLVVSNLPALKRALS
jgi:uncharacterized iron-regulated membrane protein